jgi:cytoskeleton protein RodZ
MSSLGLYLRGLRESKGMSLDDIARSTRVGRRHLEALETDTLTELPAPVFVKGFIRAYCEFLESSPDEALDLYRATTGEPPPAHGPPRPLLSPRSRSAGPLVIAIVLFVALGASLVALRFGLQSSRRATAIVSSPAREEARKAPSAPPPVAAPSPVSGKSAVVTPPASPAVPAPAAVSSPTAGATTPSATPSGPADAPAGSHHLMVRAIEPTWLRVQADEGQVAEELLQTGAVREWSAAKRFTLTVGNAGGLEIDLDGKRLPPLGARGAVIQRLVLPPESAGAGS